MLILKNHFSTNLQRYVIICFLILLINLSFVLSTQYRESINDVKYQPDDLFHISIAESFRSDKNFKLKFLVLDPSKIFHEDYMEKISTINSEQASKGPIYYILLGTVFELVSTEHEDLMVHASFFQSFLISTFLVLFFFFVKKTFSLKIAIASSLLVVFIPSLTNISVIVNMDPLVFIFLIASLFFIEKRKSHYILFSVFAGLATLTHPISTPLIATYFIFLLIKKEFKGFFISLGVWIGVLAPWLVRNWYEFQDIGKGLYIPFSTKISELISFLLYNDSTIKISYQNTSIGDQANRITFSEEGIFELLHHATYNTLGLANAQIFLVLIIFFTGIVFINLNYLQKKFLYSITIFSLVVLSSYLILNDDRVNYIIQILIILFFIPIVIFTLYKKRRQIFSINIDRKHIFIIFYCFIHLIAMYIFSANSGWTELPARFLLLQICLLTPLGAYGFKKIIKEKIPKRNLKQNLFIVSIILIIFIPTIIPMIEGQELLKEKKWITRNNSMKIIEKMILEDTKPEEIIASDNPGEIWLRTAKNSVSMPNMINDQEKFEDYLKKFNISYLVFYNLNNIPKQIMNLPPGEYVYYRQVIGSNSIINVENIMNSTIDTPEHYVAKMLKYENDGKYDESGRLLEELRNFDSNIEIEERICISFVRFNIFEDAVYTCKKILQKDNTNYKAINGLVVSYNENNEIEKRDEIIQQYNKLITKESEQEIIDSWAYTLQYLIKDDVSEKQFLIMKANIFVLMEIYDDALKIYSDLLEKEKLNPILYIRIAEIYETKGEIQLAIHNFETALKLDSDNNYLIEKIEELKKHVE